MFRLFASLVIGGVGIASALDAAINGLWWVSVFFSVLSVFVLAPGWAELRKTRQVEADLAQAEKDVGILLTQGSEFARDAASYTAALFSVRDLLASNNVEAAQIIIADALAEQNDQSTAIKFCFDWMAAILHQKNAHWWIDPATGENQRNEKYIVPTKLMLVVSELSEAMEAHRKNLADDKLPHRDGLTVEIADGLIRLFDLAGALRLNLGDAASEKVAFNDNRADHKADARMSANGKGY